jgi:hypothetical protein
MIMHYFKAIIILVCAIPLTGNIKGQAEINEEIFSEFLNEGDTSLIMLGENHSSSVAPTIYPQLIEKLNKTNDLNTLLIEFGPSEAYFYTEYLKTGNEKMLNYTIYAGYYKDWKRAWKEIYGFNQSLDEPLKIIGIDFDRTRTFAYALYNIFKTYTEKPVFVDSLMNVIRQDTFYTTYTNGYPTELDLEFKRDTRKLLKDNYFALEEMLSTEDLYFVDRMLSNECEAYNEDREKDLYRNLLSAIRMSGEKDFLLLIGRDHTYLKAIYDEDQRLATMIRESGCTGINMLTGLILHENSQQWGKDYEEAITLFEVRDKIPWKEFNSLIQKQAEGEMSVILMERDLEPLTEYVDYLVIARDQGPIAF